jgi:hypothetical protein
MYGRPTNQMQFDLLSQVAQQRLRARVADANGNIAAVADEIRSQLDEFDQEITNHPESANDRQADRAFFVAQLTFLDMLTQTQAQPEQPRERGWLARLRAAFGHAQTAE